MKCMLVILSTEKMSDKVTKKKENASSSIFLTATSGRRTDS